jgi:hypothetical protein
VPVVLKFKTMKNEIAKIIAEYLNKVESPQEKWDGTIGFFPAEWPLPIYTIAAEIADKLALNPIPTRFDKNSLPDDVKLSFHKGVELYQCIQNYELGVFTNSSFVKEMRRIDAK